MRTIQRVRSHVAFTLVLAFAVPLQARQPVSRPTAPQVQDQSLQPQGGLSGRAINPAGQPIDGLRVVARSLDGVSSEAVTDAAGHFHFPDLRAGVVAIQMGDQTSLHRLWTANAAPPAASRTPLQVVVHSAQAPVVRGQMSTMPWSASYHGGLIALALLAGGIVAITTDSDSGS